jgi:predicted deacylase
MPYSAEEMTRYEAFVAQMKEATETAKGKIKSLGKLEAGLELYRIDVNPSATRTMCIGATIHGNEPAGAFGVIEYLKKHPVPEDTRLIVLPLINPHGFVRGSRYSGRTDLNRSFVRKEAPAETQMVKDTLADEKIEFLVSLHEDSEADGFYAYVPDSVTPAVTGSLMRLVAKQFPVKEDGKYRDETVKGGLISFPEDDTCLHNLKSFEYWVHRWHGCPYICTETPSSLELGKRVRCVRGVLRWCVEKHFPKICKKA